MRADVLLALEIIGWREVAVLGEAGETKLRIINPRACSRPRNAEARFRKTESSLYLKQGAGQGPANDGEAVPALPTGLGPPLWTRRYSAW